MDKEMQEIQATEKTEAIQETIKLDEKAFEQDGKGEDEDE